MTNKKHHDDRSTLKGDYWHYALICTVMILIFPAAAGSATIMSQVEHCAEVATTHCVKMLSNGRCSSDNCRFMTQYNIRALEVIYAGDWGQTSFKKPLWMARGMAEPWCIQKAPITKRVNGKLAFASESGEYGIDGLENVESECSEDDHERLCQIFSRRLLQCLGTPGRAFK